jgi:hypothetical protein
MPAGGRGRSNILHGVRGRRSDLVCTDRIVGGGARNLYSCARTTGWMTRTSGRGSLFVFPLWRGNGTVVSGGGRPNSGPPDEQ